MPQIQVFQCPSCGASLSYEGGPETTLICQFCGTNVVIPQELRAQAAPPPPMPPLVPGGAAVPPDMAALLAKLQQITGQAMPIPGAGANATDINQLGMAAVEQLARAGQKIEAIKVYRLMTGAGLQEARDAVEAMMGEGGQPSGPASMPATQGDMAAVEQLARSGQKLEAIKVYRAMTGSGLREAVDAVEAMTGGGGPQARPGPAPMSRARPARRRGACGCFPGLLLIAGFVFVIGYLPYRLSGSYTQALSAARSNPEIVKALGEPVEADWWVWGSRVSCGSTCSARYIMGLRGSETSGTLSVVASMRAGGNYFNPPDWTVRGTVTTGAGGSFDLGRSSASLPQATAAPRPTLAPRSTELPAATAVRETPTPNIDATAEVMKSAQASWQATRPITLAAPFKDWPIGTKQDDAIAVTTTTQAQTYLMTVFPKHSSSYMNFAPQEAAAVQDFVAMVDLKYIYGDPANTYAYGLVFRLVNDDYGFFGLQNDGKFKFLIVQDTGIVEQEIEASSAIHSGVGSTNHLEVRNVGSDFVFEINSVRVWSFHKDLTPGVVGLGVDVGVKGKPAEVQFSKFAVLVPSP